jgi:hypothetical protein
MLEEEAAKRVETFIVTVQSIVNAPYALIGFHRPCPD